jgi:signal transduction histidine kinase
VDAHGGQVKAESTPGQGSRFSFTIPSANSGVKP